MLSPINNNNNSRISVYTPCTAPYIHAAIDALESGWISNYGKYIQLASEKLCTLLGVKHCILMANGTLATEALLYSVKHKYPHVKDIYIADCLFISPYNCALRHFEPQNIHILPIDFSTMNIATPDCLSHIKQGSILFVVHSMSYIVNVEAIHRLRPDLIIIEDNCEGFLGEYEGIPTSGSKATLCSSISFYANKNITSGEGGAFLTNDDDVAKHIAKVYSHGMTSTRYIHDVCAWNFRMTNVQAALLYAQLCDLDNIKKMKEDVFTRYHTLLSQVQGVQPLIDCANANANAEYKSSHWMYAVHLTDTKGKTYEDIEHAMTDIRGIEIRPAFYSVKHHEHLKDVDMSLLDFTRTSPYVTIILPSSPLLTNDEQTYIVEALKEVVYSSNNNA